MTEQDRLHVKQPSAVTMTMTHVLLHTDPYGMSGPRLIGDRHE